MKLYSSLVALSLLALTACVAPKTNRPAATDMELAAEQAEQEAMSQRIRMSGGTPKKWQNLKGARKRFETVGMRIETAGAKVCRDLGPDPERGCYFYFKMKDSEEVNAYADGKNIVVTTGMMRFIESDDELAMVMSHEYAHNLLDHIGSNQLNRMAGGFVGLMVDALAASQGVDTQGGFTNIGADAGQLSYSSDFESEADYVGMYVMANAGYNVRKVASYWRRRSIENPDGIYTKTTHPTNPERFIALNKTVTEIEYKRKKRLPLMPEFQQPNQPEI